MGFKSIELQVAIPRTQDAGKMQEQMMKQGQQFQESLTNQQLREEILKRKRVNEYDSVEDLEVNEEDKQQQSEQEQQSEYDDHNEAAELDHPYLGNNVDFTG